MLLVALPLTGIAAAIGFRGQAGCRRILTWRLFDMHQVGTLIAKR